MGRKRRSSRPVGLFAGFGLFVGIMAGPFLPVSLNAQELVDLESKIEHLIPIYERASERAEEERRARGDLLSEALRKNLDTLSVGPMTILAFRDHTAQALDLFESVWEDYAGVAEGLEDRWPRSVFFYHIARRISRDSLGVIGYGWDGLRAVMPRAWERLGTRREKVRREVALSLSTELSPGGVLEWVGNFGVELTSDYAGVYRDLASTPSVATERCFAGETAWCWEALGITASEAPWWEVWYTPHQWQGIAAALRPDQIEGGLEIHHERCMRGTSPESCEVVIREQRYLGPNRWRWVPLNAASRRSLLTLALTIGGEGSLRRFVTAPGTEGTADLPAQLWRETPLIASERLKAQLVRAAGVPADTLISRWRDNVLMARDEVGWGGGTYAGGVIPRIGWAAAFWFLVLAALAGRSTRWRLG